MGMDHYTKVKDLGGTNDAFLARDKQDPTKQVVIKRLGYGVEGMEELSVALRVQHNNIVHLLESFVHNGCLYVVTKYEPGGDLDELLGRLVKLKKMPTNLTILRWFAQLLTAVGYCHESKVMHRDIKPGNIFLSEDTAQLILGDFGSAKAMNASNMTSTFVGSPMWLSPEVLLGKPYSFSSDMWSLGCVFYEICTLTRPFSAPNFARLIQEVTAGEVTPLPSSVPPTIRELIGEMIIVDPAKRITAEGALQKVQKALYKEELQATSLVPRGHKSAVEPQSAGAPNSVRSKHPPVARHAKGTAVVECRDTSPVPIAAQSPSPSRRRVMSSPPSSAPEVALGAKKEEELTAAIILTAPAPPSIESAVSVSEVRPCTPTQITSSGADCASRPRVSPPRRIRHTRPPLSDDSSARRAVAATGGDGGSSSSKGTSPSLQRQLSRGVLSTAAAAIPTSVVTVVDVSTSPSPARGPSSGTVEGSQRRRRQSVVTDADVSTAAELVAASRRTIEAPLSETNVSAAPPSGGDTRALARVIAKKRPVAIKAAPAPAPAAAAAAQSTALSVSGSRVEVSAQESTAAAPAPEVRERAAAWVVEQQPVSIRRRAPVKESKPRKAAVAKAAVKKPSPASAPPARKDSATGVVTDSPSWLGLEPTGNLLKKRDSFQARRRWYENPRKEHEGSSPNDVTRRSAPTSGFAAAAAAAAMRRTDSDSMSGTSSSPTLPAGGTGTNAAWAAERNKDLSAIESYLHKFRGYDDDILQTYDGLPDTGKAVANQRIALAAGHCDKPLRRLEGSPMASPTLQGFAPPRAPPRGFHTGGGRQQDAAEPSSAPRVPASRGSPSPKLQKHNNNGCDKGLTPFRRQISQNRVSPSVPQLVGGGSLHGSFVRSHQPRQASHARGAAGGKQLSLEELEQIERDRQLAREKREAERAKMKEMIREQRANATALRGRGGRKRGAKARAAQMEVEIMLPDKMVFTQNGEHRIDV